MEKIEFKSQICTSRSQSEKLLALGLKKETADMCYKVLTHNWTGKEIPEKNRHYVKCTWYDENDQVCGMERYKTIPAWSLGRLLEVMRIKASSQIVPLDDTFDKLIEGIETRIKEGYFNQDYLEEEEK